MINELEHIQDWKTYAMENPSSIVLLQLYIEGTNRITDSDTVRAAFKHNGIEAPEDMEVGLYAVECIKKMRPDKNFGYIQNPKYLLDIYKQLQIDISARKQYSTIVNALMMLSYEDIAAFARMISGTWEVPDSVTEGLRCLG